MEYKRYALAGLALALAFSAGRFSAPVKVETREVEHVVDNVNRNQNVIETTKETRMPDGTVVKETRKEKETSTQTERESQTSKTQNIENRPGYRIGILYEPAIKGFQNQSGALILEKRIFSEVYIGISVSTNHTAGVTLSLGF